MPLVESINGNTGAVDKTDVTTLLDGPVDLNSGTASASDIVGALVTLGLVNDTA